MSFRAVMVVSLMYVDPIGLGDVRRAPVDEHADLFAPLLWWGSHGVAARRFS